MCAYSGLAESYIVWLLLQISLNEKMLEKIGGIKGLESKLKTDYKRGLSGDPKDLTDRIDLYGKNEVCLPTIHGLLVTFSIGRSTLTSIF